MTATTVKSERIAEGPSNSTSSIVVGESTDRLEPFLGNGEVVYMDITEPKGLLQSAPIEQGNWTWNRLHDPSASLVIDHLMLAGRLATPSSIQIHSQARTPLLTEALWGQTFKIDVLDAESGSPLVAVKVLHSERLSPMLSKAGEELGRRNAIASGEVPLPPHFHGGNWPPKDSAPLVEAAPSPILAPRVSNTGTYWIGADGFEWREWPRTAADLSPPIRVQLHRAGSLQVHIDDLDNLNDDSRTVLNLYRLTKSTSAPIKSWTPIERPDYELDALLPGSYRIEVRREYPNGASEVLAFSTLEIRPNHTQVATLSIPKWGPDLAGLSFNLTLSFSNTKAPPLGSLILESLQSDESLRIPLQRTSEGIASERYSTRSVSILPGGYSVSTEELPVTWTLTVAEGENLFDLDIQEFSPRDLVVREQTSGDPVELRFISWKKVIPLSQETPAAAINRPGLVQVASGQSVRLDLPNGLIDFTLHTNSHGPVFHSVQAQPGVSQIYIEVPAALRADLVLKRSGVPIEINEDWLMGLLIQDQKGNAIRPRTLSVTRAPGHPPTATVWFNSPGVYTLTPESLAGMPHASGQTIKVVPGVTELVVFTEES